jgi:hypothetical protein
MKKEFITTVIKEKGGVKMKVGEIVKVKELRELPELGGQQAEIVQLQTQDHETYTTYPVWARIITGACKGGVYGFHYNEVEALGEIRPAVTDGTKVADQLAEILAGISGGHEADKKALRIGTVVNIRKIPALEGQQAEIVHLQTQDYEKYTTYPVWARITTGSFKGKFYGFCYDEVEIRGVPYAGEKGRIEVVERLEKMLKGMKAKGNVRIKKCEAIPELVGELADIVDLQTQDIEKYTTYPVWARVTSGIHRNRVYGFRYDEVELVPGGRPKEAAASDLDEQLEEILRGVTEIDEIAEIEKAISEVKGEILSEPGQGFWEDKKPCWEMLRCPQEIRNECPAFKHQGLPCWQIEGTYAKLHDNAKRGCNTDICQMCRVYKRWGQEEPIEIKLTGRGFNRAVKEMR